MFVDGRYELDTASEASGRGGLQWEVTDCLFWNNNAMIGGGAIVMYNIWPLQFTIRDSNFLDGVALVSGAFQGAMYANVLDPEVNHGRAYGQDSESQMRGAVVLAPVFI